jgi:hypothetical protein
LAGDSRNSPQVLFEWNSEDCGFGLPGLCEDHRLALNPFITRVFGQNWRYKCISPKGILVVLQLIKSVEFNRPVASMLFGATLCKYKFAREEL